MPQGISALTVSKFVPGSIERQAMRQQSVDDTFLGARDVPFTIAQTDLLASNLAHQLSCSLKQQMEDEYVVSSDPPGNESERLSGTVELISNNLASRQALRLTSTDEQANALLSGKAHPIDGDLYQYWLSVTPTEGFEHLSAVSVSTYVVIPGRQPQLSATAKRSADANRSTVGYTRPDGQPQRPPISIPSAGADGLIAPLSIAPPGSISDCEWPCSLLRTHANTDAIVFFLEHQSNHGLVRLADKNCRQRTAVRVVRKNDTINFPIAQTTTNSNNWSEALDWQMADNVDTFFAVVATNSDTARKLANHIDNLPQRCSTALRPGLTGEALQLWLTEFASIAADAPKHIDWRAIEVRDIT